MPRLRCLRALRVGGLTLLGVAIAFAAAWAGYRLGPHAYAERRIRAKLEELGFADAHFEVRSVTLRGIWLDDLRLDSSFEADAVHIAYAPQDIVQGRVDTVTLVGARWRVPPSLSRFGQSVPVRLAMRPAGRGKRRRWRGPERIRLVAGRVVVERLGQTLPVDGSLLPDRGGVVFSLRTRTAGGTVKARGALRRGDGAAKLAVSARGVLAQELAGLEVRADPVRIGALGQFDGRRIRDLEVHGLVEELTVGEHALRRVEVRAAHRDEALRYRVRARSEGLSLALGGEAPAELAEWPLDAWPLRWELDGAVPAALGTRLAPAIEPSSDLEVHASGDATVALDPGPGGRRLGIEEGQLRLSAAQLAIGPLDARLREVRGDLRLRGSVGPHAARVVVQPGSRMAAGSARVGAMLWARDTELRPVLAARLGSDGVTLEGGGGLRLQAAALSLVGGDDAVHLGAVSAQAHPRGGRPLFEQRPGHARLSAAFELRAARIGGAVRGRHIRLRSRLNATSGPAGMQIDAPVELAAASLRHPDHDVALREARLTLRGTWARDGHLAGGRLAARAVSWRGIEVCAPSGRLNMRPRAIDVRLRCPAGGEEAVRLTASLGYGGRPAGSMDLVVPSIEISPEAPLGRVLAELTGARIGAHAAARARVDMEHRTASATVRWTRARLAGVAIGRGELALRSEPSGAIAVQRLVLAAGGGHIRVAPFRFDPGDPDSELALSLQGLRLDEVLRALSDGRATGTGRLDGEVGLRVRVGDRPRVQLGTGHLRARSGGRIRVGRAMLRRSVEPALGRSGYDAVVKRRILGALTDFEYTNLAFVLKSPRGTPRIAAHVRGRGASVPQELDLNLNVFGVQRLARALSPLAPVDLHVSARTVK